MKNHCIIAFRRKGLFALLALLCLLFLPSPAMVQHRPDSAKGDTAQVYIGKRNPWAALLLSGVFSGLGQNYNHERTKALVMGGIHLAFVTWYIVELSTYSKKDLEEDVKPLIPTVGIYIEGPWSMIDAFRTARRINRQNGWARPDRPRVGLVLDPDPLRPARLQLGLGLRAGF